MRKCKLCLHNSLHINYRIILYIMDIDNRKELTKADATNLSPDNDGPATVTAVGATDAVIYELD